MCTCTAFRNNNTYFGRNLDYEVSYNPSIVIVPRNYKFNFTNGEDLDKHNSIIGVALVINNLPLYYDAINEKGLGIAGLNFVDNAYYFPQTPGKTNIANYEVITYLLSKCDTVDDVKKILSNAIITDQRVSKNLPTSSLHWMITDKTKSIVVESTKTGLHIYNNEIECMTNNPQFNYQMQNLQNYRHLTNIDVPNTFDDKIDLTQYSRGMGTIGLPGGVDSMSRFVRVCFTKVKSISNGTEQSNVSQFFHILNNVAQPKGMCCLGKDSYEYTLYTSCGNLDKGLFYYQTYDNSQISCVDMFKENLDSENLICYDMEESESFNYQN